MNTDQIMQIAYLGLLAAAIGGSYIFANKNNLGKVAQQAAIWGMIFVGVIAAVGLWGDISRDVAPRQSVAGTEIVLPRSNDGHYYMTLDINGTSVNFVVDTGASQVVLTQNDAARIGLNPDELRYLGTANTANGQVRTAAVQLDQVSVGPYTDTGLRATVNGGQMDKSLLGMTYLGLYDSISITDGELILSR
jgi:aspartyl protease family protein